MADRQGQRQTARQDRLDDHQAYRDHARNEWQNWHDSRYGYHGHWYHGCWGGAYGPPGARLEYWWDNYPVMTAFGLTTWGINRIGYAFGWYNYSNPYAGGTALATTPYDYAQPIAVESPAATEVPAEGPTDGPPAAPPDVPPEALSEFDTARQQFYSGEYDAALTSVDDAIKQMPTDAVLHEFRALTLFALGRYQESAAAVYAVLSAGPGWDWTTLSGLYPRVDTYTQQLRALEQYQRSHPDDPAPRLVLAYHYLTAGHSDAAQQQLQALLRLTPDDPLARKMLAEIDPAAGPEATPPATGPPPAANAVKQESVAGTWNATRPGGETFTMRLQPDGAFTWTYSSGGGAPSQSVSGVYVIDEDSVLALQMSDGGAMLAQLSMAQENEPSFMMLGDDRGSQPLHFTRER